MRTEPQVRKVVNNYVRKWKKILCLDLWEIDIYIREWLMPGENTGDGNDAAARTHTDWRYIRGDTQYSYMLVKDMTDGEIEKLVIHEMAHYLVNQMSNNDSRSIDNEERVVSHLTVVLFNLAGGK